MAELAAPAAGHVLPSGQARSPAMRKRFLIPCAVVFSLVMVAVALAGAKSSGVKFTAKHTGASTGLNVTVVNPDPTTPQPAATSKIIVGFPSGTRFDLSAPGIQTCTLSDKQLRDQFGKKCSKKSFLGSGKAELSQPVLVPKGIPATLDAYAGVHNVILVIKPTILALKSQILVLHAA